MSSPEGSESRSLASPVEARPDAQPDNSELRADNLLREGAPLFTRNDGPSPITPDGKQIEFSSPYRENQSGTDNQAKLASLFSKDATPQQKLATVRELANAGVTDVTYRDESGKDHRLRLEVEQASNGRQMVHLFTVGADGREQTALRGIARPDGTWEQERNRAGNFVNYQGRGYAAMMGEQPGGADPRPAINPRRETPEPPDKSPRRREQIEPRVDPRFGVIDRSQFDEQLKDPRVMAAFAGRMHTEVGSQGPAAQLAFAEAVLNRAAARNQTVLQALTGSYYPTHHPGRSYNADYVAAITRAWQEGTDTVHGATGNASGRVGFGVRGGYYDQNRQWVSPNQTARFGGERFGHEQVDLNRGWLQKYEELKTRGMARARQRNSDIQRDTAYA